MGVVMGQLIARCQRTSLEMGPGLALLMNFLRALRTYLRTGCHLLNRECTGRINKSSKRRQAPVHVNLAKMFSGLRAEW